MCIYVDISYSSKAKPANINVLYTQADYILIPNFSMASNLPV